MVNPWVQHVKKWSKQNNVSYGCAISLPECKAAYKKQPQKTATNNKTTKNKTPEEETADIILLYINKYGKDAIKNMKLTTLDEVNKMIDEQNSLIERYYAAKAKIDDTIQFIKSLPAGLGSTFMDAQKYFVRRYRANYKKNTGRIIVSK